MSLTILMNSDNKELIKTKQRKIRQGESLVDEMYFLVEQTVDEMSMEDFTCTLLYLDPANISHMELLDRDPELYKETYYRYHLPIDSEFTKMAGQVKLQLSLVHQDSETGYSHVLHSGMIIIPVLSWTDFYAFTPPSSLNAIDAALLQLDNKIQMLTETSEVYEKARAVDLNLDGDLLQLKNSDGNVMGEGVTVLQTYGSDIDDNPNDAEIDLDSSGGD